MKAQILSLFAICGVLATFAPATSSATVSASATANIAAPAFSGRIDDVVKLSQSGVDESIVMSYIKTSPGPFQPDADEIIKLRDSGVSPNVITAILQRGAELREQGGVTASASTQPAPSYAAQPNADGQYATAQSGTVTPPLAPTADGYYGDGGYYGGYLDYGYPGSSVVYIGGAYDYPYYPYWGVGFGWPWFTSYCSPFSCFPFWRTCFPFAPFCSSFAHCDFNSHHHDFHHDFVHHDGHGWDGHHWDGSHGWANNNNWNHTGNNTWSHNGNNNWNHSGNNTWTHNGGASTAGFRGNNGNAAALRGTGAGASGSHGTGMSAFRGNNGNAALRGSPHTATSPSRANGSVAASRGTTGVNPTHGNNMSAFRGNGTSFRNFGGNNPFHGMPSNPQFRGGFAGSGGARYATPPMRPMGGSSFGGGANFHSFAGGGGGLGGAHFAGGGHMTGGGGGFHGGGGGGGFHGGGGGFHGSGGGGGFHR